MFFIHYMNLSWSTMLSMISTVFESDDRLSPGSVETRCATTLIGLPFLVIVLPATKFRTNLIYHDESWHDTEGLFKLSYGHKLGDGSQIYSCY